MADSKCFLGITPYTLIADAIGTDVNTSFPYATRVATFKFNQNLGILGLQFSSTLTNVSAGLVGLFVVIGGAATMPLVNLTSNNQGMYVSHITNLNAVAGFASPASRSTTIGFGDSGIHLTSTMPVSIYACSDNVADNLITGILNIYTIITT